MQPLRASRLPSATHVADYMLASAALDHNLNLDQLQLNKLLYITNGFVLQDRDDPAFRNPVEAWKYGPVIRTVWETYNGWGDAPIRTLDMCRTPLSDKAETARRRDELLKIIGMDVAGVVGGVLEGYGQCTGGELVDMTHRKGTPWSDAYRRGRNNVIPTESIASFYRGLSSHNAR